MKNVTTPPRTSRPTVDPRALIWKNRSRALVRDGVDVLTPRIFADTECMADLRIRDIPDEVRDILAQRAKGRGQSLNSYLRDVVIREASSANNRALIDRVVAIRGDSRFTIEDVLAARSAR